MPNSKAIAKIVEKQKKKDSGTKVSRCPETKH